MLSLICSSKLHYCFQFECIFKRLASINHFNKNLLSVFELVPYLFYRNIYRFLALGDLRNNGLSTQTNFLKSFISLCLLLCYSFMRIFSCFGEWIVCVCLCVCLNQHANVPKWSFSFYLVKSLVCHTKMVELSHFVRVTTYSWLLGGLFFTGINSMLCVVLSFPRKLIHECILFLYAF